MSSTLPPERQLRVTCGDRQVIVYPRRFSARLSEDVRRQLGRGPREAYGRIIEAEYYELDQIAEMVLIGHLQAGIAMTKLEAQDHPIVTEWDTAGGTAVLEDVPSPPDLATAVALTAVEDAPSPES